MSKRQGLGSLSSSAYLRLFAAASIVWFHVVHDGPQGVVGAIGLMLFIHFSFMHLGREHGYRVFLNRATRQLLIPWAGWWLFYAALRFWTARGVPSELVHVTSVETLLAFPAVHLWYLPFVFVVSLALTVVREAVAPSRAPLKVALALVTALILLPWLGSIRSLPTTVQIILYSLPAAALGLAYSYCLRLESALQRQCWFIAIAILANIACVPVWVSGNYMVAVGYTGSTILMVLCTISVPRNKFVMRLSGLTLGIYLAHPFIMQVMWKFGGGAFRPRWLFALTAFVLSAFMVAGMRRIPYLRALV